jgi:exopolysaccharide biosynthesis polyprenyl glycosylphosphotransferase
MIEMPASSMETDNDATDPRSVSTRDRIRLPDAIGLSLHNSERSALLFIVDVLALSAALVVAVSARSDLLDPQGAIFAYWYWFVTLAVLWWLIGQLFGAFDLARAASASHSILTAGAAAALTSLIYQMIPVITPPLASRKLSLLFGILAVLFVVIWRGVYARLFVQPSFQKRALVLGAGQSGQTLASLLQSVPELGNPFAGSGYRIVGFVDDDPAKHSVGAQAGLPVLGTSRDLVALARDFAVDEIVVAITHRHTMSQETFDAVLACREQGLPVTTMTALYERLLGRVPVDHVGRNLDAVLPEEGGPGARLFWVSKRFADVSVALICVVPLAVVTSGVALANLFGNRGSLFYRQVRVGKGGREFSVWKYRSMIPDAESGTGATWSTKGDPRITPIGRWLRRSRLDELPQMINVLAGDMSVVGPRPERPEFVDDLALVVPYYRARHAVRPGLTGWAQVRYGYGSSVEDTRAKLEHDLYYVRHAGFYLDLLILLKTVSVVLRLEGR